MPIWGNKRTFKSLGNEEIKIILPIHNVVRNKQTEKNT